MKEPWEDTESLCPVCLNRIPARRAIEGENVYLEKTCPEHGSYKVLLWRGAELYREWGQRAEPAKGPQKRLTDTNKGCPYDCGLCPAHEADTCTVVMEVTYRCNLSCPICFASARKDSSYEPDLDMIRDMYQTILDCGGAYPVQLSGGEPTVRDDLPQIVNLGTQMGFSHIQINTNGIRLARDKEYLQELKDAGASVIYLQFDGVTDDVYRHTRGQDLLDLKLQAISNCAQARMGVILVPTLIPKVNDHQIGDIIQFAKERIPTVKGVHFQPVSYFGRYPAPPEDADRITIPDVLEAIMEQTKGEFKRRNFVPRRCEDAHCSFSSLFVLDEEGKLLPLTGVAQDLVSGAGYLKGTPAEQSRRFISRRWRSNEEEPKTDCGCCQSKPGIWQSFFERASVYYLSITGMPFQDVWNIDLDRLKRCCIHVVTPDRKLIPLCAYYLTSVKGERLYPSPSLTAASYSTSGGERDVRPYS